MRFNISISCLFSVALLVGCASADPTFQSVSQSDLIAANYAAADALIVQSRERLVPDQPILIATLVKIDALDKSSTLGRVSSENIGTRFTKAGYDVVEMKFGNSVYMKRDEGEMVLTREITNIARDHNAQAVVLGSYGIGADGVYVNVKVVRPGKGNIIIASHDYVLPRNREIDSMLSSEQGAR